MGCHVEAVTLSAVHAMMRVTPSTLLLYNYSIALVFLGWESLGGPWGVARGFAHREGSHH